MKSQDRKTLFALVEASASALHEHIGRVSSGNGITTKAWMGRYVALMTAIAQFYSQNNSRIWTSTITGETRLLPVLTIEDFWIASALLDLELIKQSARIHDSRLLVRGREIRDACYNNALGLLSNKFSWREKLRVLQTVK